MDAALMLYRKTGFDLISPYYDTPLKGTIFLGRRLDTWESKGGWSFVCRTISRRVAGRFDLRLSL